MWEDQATSTERPLRHTPLDSLHRELGAKMVPFAGYDMPVQYPDGVLSEHNHTRTMAGLFDVSHMGQVRIAGGDPASALERLVPADLQALAPGRMRYTMLTNEGGGIRDDVIVTRDADSLLVVVNAACKDADLAYLREQLTECTVELLEKQGLVALQGPAAAAVMDRVAPEAVDLRFMESAAIQIERSACVVSRSGYTGEDGFEISVPARAAEGLARRLLNEPEVAPIGLGARDSLRLEAGLCLHGNDIDGDTSPVEAGLAWTIGKARRDGNGFPGAAIIARQLGDGPKRRRVGIRPLENAPARAHTAIEDEAGAPAGMVTSGGYGPTVGGPIAMGYVPSALAECGTEIGLIVRGRMRPASVSLLPFVPHRYVRT